MAVELFRDRGLVKGQKVKVYKNLHRGCLSIMDYKSRLVVAYADCVSLENVTFKISKSGQGKCRNSGVRNVHAFAVGTFLHAEPYRRSSHLDQFTYNPFQNDTFVDRLTGFPVYRASKVRMSKGKYYYSQ